jgi:hypothetical protein
VHEYGLGRRKPSFANVLKLARALGVTCEAFASCTDLDGGAESPPAPRTGKARKPAAGGRRGGAKGKRQTKRE